VPSKDERAPRPHKSFADHLKRMEIVIEPEVPAGCAALWRVLVGEGRQRSADEPPPAE
jgi:transposase